MGIIEAVILGVVEGLTEFLPVSSTGHMIITSSLLGIQKDEFTKLFEVSIQFGAILAVVILYGKNIDTAPIDVVGPSISIASKIASAAQLNQVLVGQSLYDILASDDSFNHRFINVKLTNVKWNYMKPSSGNIYELYSYG